MKRDLKLSNHGIKIKSWRKTVIVAVALLMVTAVAYSSEQHSALRKVDPSYVCMTNNKDMGAAQMAVKVGEKTYYGCCKMCAANLRNNKVTQTAVDPVTGNKVDKAKAIIGALPGGNVLYFENEDSFNAFHKQKMK